MKNKLLINKHKIGNQHINESCNYVVLTSFKLLRIRICEQNDDKTSSNTVLGCFLDYSIFGKPTFDVQMSNTSPDIKITSTFSRALISRVKDVLRNTHKSHRLPLALRCDGNKESESQCRFYSTFTREHKTDQEILPIHSRTKKNSTNYYIVAKSSMKENNDVKSEFFYQVTLANLKINKCVYFFTCLWDIEFLSSYKLRISIITSNSDEITGTKFKRTIVNGKMVFNAVDLQ